MTQWTKKHRVLVIVIAVVIIAGVGMAILLPGMKESTQSPSVMAKQNTMKLEKMDLTSSISATGSLFCNGTYGWNCDSSWCGSRRHL